MNNEKNNDLIKVITQAFYGNRVGTAVSLEKLDRFVIGCLHDMPIDESRKLDRTIIKMPNADNLVIIYNKYEEEKDIELVKTTLEKDGYEIKPLAIIPEYDMKLYSRCIACRMNENGELESVEKEDYDKIIEYFVK